MPRHVLVPTGTQLRLSTPSIEVGFFPTGKSPAQHPVQAPWHTTTRRSGEMLRGNTERGVGRNGAEIEGEERAEDSNGEPAMEDIQTETACPPDSPELPRHRTTRHAKLATNCPIVNAPSERIIRVE